MGSPITFSGFNSIDFTVVLNAIMQQESVPLQAMQAKQTALKATDTAFGQLASRLDTLRNASATLATPSSLTSYTAGSTDASAVAVSASSNAVAGTYDVVVNDLARGQVTVSDTFAPDTDTAIVATGGTLTIGGETIDIEGSVTLRQLAAAINANTDSPAGASIVATAAGEYRLVLTSKSTGATHGFTIDNQLTATTIAFADGGDIGDPTRGNGISGDNDLDNAVKATDAKVLINNILVTSASNTVDAGIPGVTVTLLQKDVAKHVMVTVARNDGNLADRVETFATAYNDLVKFANAQAVAAGNGSTGTIGRDSLLRGLRGALRDSLSGAHGSGTYTRLAELGIGFARTGELKLDRAALTAAVEKDPAAVQALFTTAGTGAFTSVNTAIDDYASTGGLVSGARTQIAAQIARLARRMDDVQTRLAVRRLGLQKEFTAADLAMTRLSNQQSSLAGFSASLNANSL